MSSLLERLKKSKEKKSSSSASGNPLKPIATESLDRPAGELLEEFVSSLKSTLDSEDTSNLENQLARTIEYINAHPFLVGILNKNPEMTGTIIQSAARSTQEYKTGSKQKAKSRTAKAKEIEKKFEGVFDDFNA